MRYLLFFIGLSFFTLGHASSNYPQLFSAQGTPLYKSAKNIAEFNKVPSLEIEVSKYLQQLSDTQELGFKVDSSLEETNKRLYLKTLRSLQKSQDKILQHSIKELTYKIKKDEYQKFLDVANAGMFYYQEKPILKEKILTYYKKNRTHKRSALLDAIIKKENSLVTHYASTITNNENNSIKEIILLSRPGCAWCLKAKQLLQSSGNAYSEYNIMQSQGKRLFQKYNGTGVPVIIIDEKVIKGFNKNAILSALK